MKSDHSVKNIKAMVIDLEGALLNGMKDVTPAASRILREMHERGVMIILCTSQNPAVISRRLRDWQLEDCIPYIIGRWGSSLLNRYTGKLTCLAAVVPASIEHLQQMAAQSSVSLCLQQGRNLYAPARSFLCSLQALKMRKPLVTAPLPLDKPVSSLQVFGWTQDLKKFSQALQDDSVHLHSAGRFGLTITSAAASSEQTVYRLLERHDLQGDEVLTIAAGEDFAGLFDTTWGAAMKNADPLLLEKAVWITKYPSGQDGVAYFMNQALISGEFSFGNPACLVHLSDSMQAGQGQSVPSEASAGEST